jgi:undecaprenyl-diphosphatase
VTLTSHDPATQPPITPGYDRAAPRERGVPTRALLPPPARARIAEADVTVDRLFDRLRGRRFPDRLFYDASELADFSLLWHLVGVARGVVSPRREREVVRLSVCLGIESVLVNGVIKSLFRRTRPAWEQHRPRRLRRPRSSSFPSGHASAAFTAAALLSDDDRAWPLYYAAAVVVSCSRIHVKIHHASDVAAGAGLGMVLGRVARRAWPLRDG